MIRLTPSGLSYGLGFSDYVYSYHIDILWDADFNSGNLNDQSIVIGIVLNIYDGYPVPLMDELSAGDVYGSHDHGHDYYYSNDHSELGYIDAADRFKWVRLYCVRGDKGIRLVEIDLHKVRVVSGNV
jgi:hypothetical protein